MKKILFLIVIGALVAPLVIAGSGITHIFSSADVTGGWLEYSQTNYWGSDLDQGVPPGTIAASTNLGVINLGDSVVTSHVVADDATVFSGGFKVPNVRVWNTVDVDPLVCPTQGGGNGGGNIDPYKTESIGWGSTGEAYLKTATYTEDNHELSVLSVYGKGGATGSWNTAGLQVNSDEGFYEWSYAALGDFCENVDKVPPTPEPPMPPIPPRPDCTNGFCP